MDIDELITTKRSFLVMLDSRNGTRWNNGSWNSSVYFEFEEPIRIPKNAIQCLCSVLSFSAPNSLYIINETNNILSITLNDTQYTYTIPYGNYNAKTFIATMKTILDSGFTMTIDTISNIFTLTHKDNDFSIDSSSTIYRVMGFSKNTTYYSTNKTLAMPYNCNFNGLNSLNITFANLNTPNIDSFNKSNSSIIQSVPIVAGSNQIIFNKCHDFNFEIKQDIIDYIEINIQDDLENLLNFNNHNWNLTLYFTIIYDKERFPNSNHFHQILANGF